MKREELIQLQRDTFENATAILSRKNHDYSGGLETKDSLANFKCASVLGIHPLVGLLLRVQDKLQRIKTYVEVGSLHDGDSVIDACEDIVNYAVLAKALILDAKTP